MPIFVYVELPINVLNINTCKRSCTSNKNILFSIKTAACTKDYKEWMVVVENV